MKRLPLWVVAAASVLLLVVLSTRQTGALWRDSTRISGGIITSGKLTILAGGSENYIWSAFGGTNLASGSTVQQPLLISITGDVDVGYRLHSITQSSTDVPLVITAWVVGSTAGCPTSTGAVVPAPSNPISGPWTTFPAPPTARVARPGSSEVWCVRATVGATAQQGKSTEITLTFRADQKQ